MQMHFDLIINDTKIVAEMKCFDEGIVLYFGRQTHKIGI